MEIFLVFLLSGIIIIGKYVKFCGNENANLAYDIVSVLVATVAVWAVA